MAHQIIFNTQNNHKMQEILLTGNVGKDAEMKEHQGKPFATFSVGCTTRRKNGDEVKETTNWYDCATDNMKVAQFIKKGIKILVRGNFKLDQYHSDTLNKWVPVIKVYAQDIELLSPKKDDTAAPQQNPPTAQSNATEPTPPPIEMAGNGGDDLPF